MRRHEHQHALPALGLDQVPEQFGAPVRVHCDHALHDGRLLLRGRVGHLDQHRILQQRTGQRLHRRAQRGGKQQGLATRRQQGQHTLDLVGEPEIQQAVGLVHHQHLDLGQAQRVVCHQIQQPPRRGHRDVGTAAQAHHLRIDRHAAKQHGHLHRLGQVLRKAADHLAHLGGQLPRGYQHEPAQAPG
jgi:hypothetical protein